MTTPRKIPGGLYTASADGIISNASRPTKNPPHKRAKPSWKLWNTLAIIQAIPAPILTLENRNPPSINAFNLIILLLKIVYKLVF